MNQTLDDLPTPALILDRAILRRNLKRMSDRLRQAGVLLRPHLKTAKSVQIGRMAVEGHDGRITVSTQVVDRGGAEPPAVRVTVADTGRGMTEDEAGRIFNDFYTTKEGGTGLGLSIVRRLVMDLNGVIGVESSPGSGTHVFVDIPANGPSREDYSRPR